MATRLALAVIGVSALSLLITGIVGFASAESPAEDLLRERLPSVRSAKALEIEGYLANARAQVAEMTQSRMFIEGVQRFDAAHAELAATLEAADVSEARDRVGAYYLDGFIPDLEAVRGEPVPPLSVATPGTDLAATYLQDVYIASSPLEPEEKGLLTDGRDDSTWTRVHNDLHPDLREIVERFGFADLLLIEPDTNTIVYSTAKEIDFASSLADGPHSGSNLARLVNRVIASGEPGVLVADFETYAPSLDAPAAFMAGPLFDGEELVGVVAVQLSTEDIGQIMTSNWRDGDLGETGELYLVGPDDRLRSPSRLFVEDRSAYLAQIDDTEDVTDAERQSIIRRGTPVLVQPVDNEAVDAAQALETGVLDVESYLGRETVAAYAPVMIDGLDWVIVAEQDRSEVRAPLDDFTTRSLVIGAVFMAVLTFFALVWGNAFVAPVRAISRAVRALRVEGASAAVGSEHGAIPAGGAREFQQLAHDFNRMVEELARRDEAVERAAAEKRAVLERLLPKTAASAVARGDRSLLEVVPSATVGVLVLNGLDDLVRTETVVGSRSLLHQVIDELDSLAERRGLERIKVVADTYYAACGLASAQLDHAPRTVSFALEARAAVRRIGAESGRALDVAAGIHTGSATVGLTGPSRLVYDLWGDALQTAHRLSRTAQPGQIVISDAVRERLPPEQTQGATEVEVPLDVVAWGIGDSAPATSGGRSS